MFHHWINHLLSIMSLFFNFLSSHTSLTSHSLVYSENTITCLLQWQATLQVSLNGIIKNVHVLILLYLEHLIADKDVSQIWTTLVINNTITPKTHVQCLNLAHWKSRNTRPRWESTSKIWKCYPWGGDKRGQTYISVCICVLEVE